MGTAVEILVHAQPRASRSRVVGEHGGRLKVQLAALPADGEANRALLLLFAEVLHVPRSKVSVRRGETGRRKVIRVEGVTLASASRLIEAALP
jgi:uncharacterized protein (TIGR00251 family)